MVDLAIGRAAVMYVSLLVFGILAWCAILFMASVGASYLEHLSLAEALLVLAHGLLLVGLLVYVVWAVTTLLIAERNRAGKR